MKLQLSEHKGVHVLSIDGPIGGHNSMVLKAGITKLFKDGKNRLVLELKHTPELSDATIRELGVMNQFARELAGEIVLVIESDDLRSKIANFGAPTPVKCFATKLDGVDSFKNSGLKLDLLSPKTLEERDNEIKQLKEQLRAKEGGELAQLRSENSRLKDEAAVLEDRLEKMIIQRRPPADEKGYLEKGRILEAEIENLLAQVAKLEAEGPRLK